MSNDTQTEETVTEKPKKAKAEAKAEGKSEKPKKPKVEVPNLESPTVPFERLLADPAKNSRQDYDGIEELAADIEANGLMQPIVVRIEKSPKLTEDERELLNLSEGDSDPDWIARVIAGYRRYYAISHLREQNPKAFKAGVPITDMSKGNSTDDFIRNLVENLDRKQLSVADAAEAFYKLKNNVGMAVDDIAQRVPNLTKGYISNLISLRAKASPQVMDALREGKIGFDVARSIIKEGGKEEGQNELLETALAATEGQEDKKRKRGVKDAVKKKAKGADKEDAARVRPTVSEVKAEFAKRSEAEEETDFEKGVRFGLAWVLGERKRIGKG